MSLLCNPFLMFGAGSPPPDPDPEPDPQPERGAAPLGTASYSVPSGSLFVSSTFGNNSFAGTSVASPKATIGAAVSAASSGQYIFVLDGDYNESVTVSTKAVHIRNYPGEYYTLIGSRLVASWTSDSGKWWATNTFEVDHGTSFSAGSSDVSWNGPTNPYGSYPDAVYVDGELLTQVGTLGDVTTGKCFFDYAADRVYIGTNPSGHEVRVGNKTNAVNFSYPGCTIAGGQITQYSNPISSFGALILARTGCWAENMWIEDIATVGVSVGMSSQNGKNIPLRNCTIQRIGMLGVHGNWCDGVNLESNVVTECNSQLFDTAPTAAGIKLTHCRGVKIRNNDVSDNYSIGIWTDESVYDFGIYCNTVNRNVSAGFDIECSGNGVIAGNYIDCGGVSNAAVYIYTSGNVKFCNNAVTGAVLHDFQVRTDSRRPTVGYTSSSQRDQRYTDWATYATGWHWDGVDVFNNVFGGEGPRSLWVQAVSGATTNPDSATMFFRNNYLPNRASAGGTAMMMYYTAGNSGSNTWHTVSSIVAHNAAWSGNHQSSTRDDLDVMLANVDHTWALACPSKSDVFSFFDTYGVINSVTGNTASGSANITTSSLFDIAGELGIAVGDKLMGPPASMIP